MVVVGSPAPDFSLSNQFGEEITLSTLKGAPVAIVFYPLAFSHTCGGELCELRDNIEMFESDGVRLLGVSVDSKHVLRAWAEQEGFGFELLSDFWPHGAVAKDYGVFLEDRGFANRATFLIDADGLVRAAFETAPGEARSLTAYREALAALSR